jgi:hypothetical protein
MLRALAVVGALALTACTHQPTISHPVVPEVGDREAALDCAALDVAIARADTVRWVIRKDGARLLTPSEIGVVTLGSVALTAATWFPVALPYNGHFELTRTDRRLRDLLERKREKDCPALQTGLPELTDLELLDDLAKLMDDDASRSTRERLEERTRLLDGLRPLPW